MTEPSNPSDLDRIYAALDANCGALMALELTCALARSGAKHDEILARATDATEAVRLAIDELRRAVGQESAAAGFVLPNTRGHDPPSASAEPGRQPKPRRTA